eukprot:5284664-Amphidinium_carterae.1
MKFIKTCIVSSTKYAELRHMWDTFKAVATMHFWDRPSTPSNCSGIDPANMLWPRNTTCAFIDEGITPEINRFRGSSGALKTR